MYTTLFSYLNSYIPVKSSEFEMISSACEKKQFEKNEYVLIPGNYCKNIFFVNQGCLRFFSASEEGAELTRYFGFEKKFATALTSFIQKEPSQEYIQAVLDTEVLMIKRKRFYELEASLPIIKMMYKNMLEQAYITSQNRIYSFQGKSASQRLEFLTKEQPDILKTIPHKMIASYLGVTPFTLSRLLKNNF